MEEKHKDGGNGKSKGKKAERSLAKRIITLVSKEDVALFHDESDQAYARVPVDAHYEIWPVQSEYFKDWLARLLWQRDSKPAGTDAVNSALSVLRAKARFDGDEYRLWNRVAYADGAIWYDLADPAWRAVKISPAGWEVVESPPILFRRFSHQQAQVLPVPCRSDLTELLGFLNIKDKSQGMLLLVWLACCLVPEIPHPIAVFHGPKGSAKTTALKMLRRLIDPSTAEVLSPTPDGRELVQQFSHQWAPFIDNMTRIPQWLSDAFCRAVTGEGFSKRQLYTDDEDVIYSYKRCIGITGINVVAHQSDLLDRCILIELEHIGDNYKPEEWLYAEFETLRPRLVSAMFTVLTRAMAIKDSIRPSRAHRMADFVAWGSAIAVALGWTQEEFEAAYDRNAKLRTDEVLDSDVVANAIVQLMESEETWVGTSSELLTTLEGKAEEIRINPHAKGWPGNASALSKRLKVVETDLAATGILVTRERESRQREIRIVRQPAPSLSGPQRCSSCDGSDGSQNLLSSGEAHNHAGYDGNDRNDGRFTALVGKERKESIYTPPKEAKSPVTRVTPVMRRLSPSITGDCVPNGCDGSSDTSGDGARVPSLPERSSSHVGRTRKLPLEVSDWPQDYRDQYEERAAIVEFGSGRTRPCSEVWAELFLREMFEKESGNGDGGDPVCGDD